MSEDLMAFVETVNVIPLELDEGKRPVPEHIFPVNPPVISLLIPCYDFSLKTIYSRVCAWIRMARATQRPKFPVFFPVNGNFWQRRVSTRLHPPPEHPICFQSLTS